MTLETIIKNNPPLIVGTLLLTGFIAGWGATEAINYKMKLETVSAADVTELNNLRNITRKYASPTTAITALVDSNESLTESKAAIELERSTIQSELEASTALVSQYEIDKTNQLSAYADLIDKYDRLLESNRSLMESNAAIELERSTIQTQLKTSAAFVSQYEAEKKAEVMVFDSDEIAHFASTKGSEVADRLTRENVNPNSNRIWATAAKSKTLHVWWVKDTVSEERWKYTYVSDRYSQANPEKSILPFTTKEKIVPISFGY